MTVQDQRPTPAFESAAASLIHRLQGGYTGPTGPTSAAASAMARLRQVTPGKVDEDPRVWELIFAANDEGQVPSGPDVTRRELALHAGLALYAVHQQSQTSPMHVSGVRLGRALRRLERISDDSLQRRFASLLTASTFDATNYHLRGLMTLLRREGVVLDHIALTGDLLRLLNPSTADRVRRQWGRDFYATRQTTATTAVDDTDRKDLS